MKLLFNAAVVILLLSTPVTGQDHFHTRSRKAIKLYENGGREYGLLNYQESIKLLHQALKIDNEFLEAWLLLGQVYTDADRLEESIEAYLHAIEVDSLFFPAVFYLVAVNEYSIGRYQSALPHMMKFLRTGYGSEEIKSDAKKIIGDCSFSIRAIDEPVPFNPVNLGPGINTEYDEYWPALSVDERVMIFTALIPIDTNNPKAYMNRQEDFFFSEFSNELWQPSVNAGYPPNTKRNEGAQSVSVNGKILFFTACNREDGLGKCDLYVSEKHGNQWSIPHPIGAPVNSSGNEKQPSVSSDGKMLYFVSDRKGSKGGYDIWISNRNEDGTWQEPVNAGDSINTPGDEQSPFIHQDNQTLYFSSTGWPGLGKYDLYMSRRNADDTWQKPVNLGYPINSWNNEEGLIVNARGNKAYFSSDRLSGRGRDIFEFELYDEIRPVKVSYMKGKVFDAETLQRLQARFELIDLKSGKLVVESASEPGTGGFLVCIPALSDFALNVSGKVYLFYSDHFSMEMVYDREDPFLKDIPLQPVKTGQSIILKNVFYAYDSAELMDNSRIELNKVVQLMNDNPTMKVEISGHTDNSGTPDYNLGLSERRAASVVNYLKEHGIEADRMSSLGYGMTIPLASNDTEEGKAMNRRTELKIISK